MTMDTKVKPLTSKTFQTPPASKQNTDEADGPFPRQLSRIEQTKTLLSNAKDFSWKKLTSHIGLFFLLMLFTFAGGGMMYGIEKYFTGQNQTCVGFNQEVAKYPTFQEYFANRTLRNVTRVREQVTVLDVSKVLEEYELEKRRKEECGPIPNYWEWVVFCLTVYTTIGYGSIHPLSRPGRIATMFYATVGIPLFLLTMGKFGKLFTRGVKFLWSRIRKLFYLRQLKFLRKNKVVQKLTGSGSSAESSPVHVVATSTTTSTKASSSVPATTTKSSTVTVTSSSPSAAAAVAASVCVTSPQQQQHQSLHVDVVDNASYVSFNIDDEFNLHPLVAISITLLYILIGSVMYIQWEDSWHYYDAFYFIFISISTIGFGDVVPKHPKFFLLSSIYILFGLALVAMVITVLSQFFTETIKVVAETLPEIHLHSDDDDDDVSHRDIRAGLEHLAVNFKPHSPPDGAPAPVDV